MSSKMEVLCFGSLEQLNRPCVDCGQWTGRFCDYCYAVDRLPSEQWADGQLTPLCSACDNARDSCHYCRGVQWCSPFPWGQNPTVPADTESSTDSDEESTVPVDKEPPVKESTVPVDQEPAVP